MGKVQGGPAPRPLEIFPISGDANAVILDTGTVTQRKAYNLSQVLKI